MRWTGNRGEGTTGYRSYGREHIISAAGLPDIAGTADPTFHGDAQRWNPEQLLLAALSQCHMLSYLHMAVKHSLVVTSYADHASGTLKLNYDAAGSSRKSPCAPRWGCSMNHSANWPMPCTRRPTRSASSPAR